jgi:hypothetical protein
MAEVVVSSHPTLQLTVQHVYCPRGLQYANLKVSTIDERLRQLNTSTAVDLYRAEKVNL